VGKLKTSKEMSWMGNSILLVLIVVI